MAVNRGKKLLEIIRYEVWKAAHQQGGPDHHFPDQHLPPCPPIPPCPDPTTEHNREDLCMTTTVSTRWPFQNNVRTVFGSPGTWPRHRRSPVPGSPWCFGGCGPCRTRGRCSTRATVWTEGRKSYQQPETVTLTETFQHHQMFRLQKGYNRSIMGTNLALSLEAKCQDNIQPKTGKEFFKFYYLASWSGERRNVPPEPLFSLCHLVLLFFLLCNGGA